MLFIHSSIHPFLQTLFRVIYKKKINYISCLEIFNFSELGMAAPVFITQEDLSSRPANTKS
jgi:hypothetical protein